MFFAGAIRRLAAPGAPARCEQRAPEARQKEDGQTEHHASPPVDPLAAAAAFVGVPLFGAAAGAPQDAVEHSPSPPVIKEEEIDLDRPLPAYSSDWERLLNHTVGLYEPQQFYKPHSSVAIAAATADLKKKLDGDDPRDACKYLLLEEYKCLRENQSHKVGTDKC